MHSKVNYFEISTSSSTGTDVNLLTINGISPAVNNGSATNGTLRVAIADTSHITSSGADLFVNGTSRQILTGGIYNDGATVDLNPLNTSNVYLPLSISKYGELYVKSNDITNNTYAQQYKFINMTEDSANYRLFNRSFYMTDIIIKSGISHVGESIMTTNEETRLTGINSFLRIPRNNGGTQLYVASSSAADTTQAVTIYGYTTASASLQNEIVALNGQTKVQLTTVFYSIDHMECDLFHEGTIWLAGDINVSGIPTQFNCSLIPKYCKISNDSLIVPRNVTTLYPHKINITNMSSSYNAEVSLVTVLNNSTVMAVANTAFDDIENYQVALNVTIPINSSVNINCSHIAPLTRTTQSEASGFMIMARGFDNTTEVSVSIDFVEKNN